MKNVAFILTMPRSNTWNGKWSGDDKVYARVHKVYESQFRGNPALQKAIEVGEHFYDFGDGWTACVSVKVVDAKTANKLIQQSVGFSGYDWMIDSLRKHGEIRRDWNAEV